MADEHRDSLPATQDADVSVWHRDQFFVVLFCGPLAAIGLVICFALGQRLDLGLLAFAAFMNVLLQPATGKGNEALPLEPLPEGAIIESAIRTALRIAVGIGLLAAIEICGIWFVPLAAGAGGVALSRSIRFAVQRRKLVRDEQRRGFTMLRTVPKKWLFSPERPAFFYVSTSV